MAAKKSASEPEKPKRADKLHPTLSVLAIEYINDLMRLGYGPTDDQVAAYLIMRSLDDLIRAKVINPHSRPRGETVPK
jgi:hypothetical protein